MDYKDLLKRYINFVGDVEGSDFLFYASVGDEDGDDFTKEELEELKRMSYED